MAVRRFIARRGPPAEIYSGNRTYFQASKDLEQHKTNKVLASTFTSAQTESLPLAALHIGEYWERLIRSVKVAIEAVADETILVKAEFNINSKPFTYIPLEAVDTFC